MLLTNSTPLRSPMATLPLSALGHTPHGLLAELEEGLHLAPDALPARVELAEHFPVVGEADAGEAFFGALHLAREFDEQQPELAGDFGDGRVRPVVVDGPVVDPFAEAVGVEDGAE